MKTILSKQHPILVWYPDRRGVDDAHKLLSDANIVCSEVVDGEYYSVFCAYCTYQFDSELMKRVLELASVVQVNPVR